MLDLWAAGGCGGTARPSGLCKIEWAFISATAQPAWAGCATGGGVEIDHVVIHVFYVRRFSLPCPEFKTLVLWNFFARRASDHARSADAALRFARRALQCGEE